MQQTSPKAMQLNPSEAGWDHGLDIMGSLRQSSHLLPGIDCKQSLFCSKCCQYPRYSSGTVPVLEYKVLTLYQCNKVDTGTKPICQFWGSHYFVLAAKFMIQYGVWQGEIEQLCSQSHIAMGTQGVNRTHNTILCGYPGTDSWAPIQCGQPL